MKEYDRVKKVKKIKEKRLIEEERLSTMPWFYYEKKTHCFFDNKPTKKK